MFVASLIAIAAAGPFSRFRILGTFAYLLGAAALGALAIGHEYIHRTLGVLLSQPVRGIACCSSSWACWR